MVVDLLRSCYTAKIRFFKDDAKQTPIRWYFCDAAAKRLPFHTSFASGNWASDKFRPWTGVGEVKGSRKYYDGANINGYIGDHACGTADQFKNGLSINDPVEDILKCCKPAICLNLENLKGHIVLENGKGCITLEST